MKDTKITVVERVCGLPADRALSRSLHRVTLPAGVIVAQIVLGVSVLAALDGVERRGWWPR